MWSDISDIISIHMKAKYHSLIAIIQKLPNVWTLNLDLFSRCAIESDN